jgi:hypothetical protein
MARDDMAPNTTGGRTEDGPNEDGLTEDGLSENLQTSTGGGMGPESYPPDEEEDFSGNGAGRGPG